MMDNYNLKMDITMLKECISYHSINRYNLMIECDYFYNYKDYVQDVNLISGIGLVDIFTDVLMRPDKFIELIGKHGVNEMPRKEFYKSLKKLSILNPLRTLHDNLDFKTFSHLLDMVLINVIFDDFTYQDKPSWI